MSFIDYFPRYKLKNKASWIIKIQQVLGSIGLDNVGIYFRDGAFSSDIGIVNSHPLKGTNCVFYIKET